MRLHGRLDRLEVKLRQQADCRFSPWDIPMLDVPPDDDSEEHLEALRREAIRQGWRPESGRPYVIITYLPEGTQ